MILPPNHLGFIEYSIINFNLLSEMYRLPKTLDDLLNHPGGNLTYQDYTSDIREILAYNRTQNKDIMSELNVQFVIADGTFQIKD